MSICVEVQKNENLYRRIHRNYVGTQLVSDLPTSAMFKDSKGLSVDRCFFRTHEEITTGYISSFGSDYIGCCYFAKDVCDTEKIIVQYDPKEENRYHTVIMNTIEKPQLSKKQAHVLKDSCIVDLVRIPSNTNYRNL